MATIVATVTSGLHPTATKTFNLPDAEIDRLVAAYQIAANASVNATATYAQVLNYIFTTKFIAGLVADVKAREAAVAAATTVPPAPINPV